MKLVKTIVAALSLPLLFSGAALASTSPSEAEIEKIESGRSIYEDKIDISYLSKMVIHPKDDWIGKKVFMYEGACIEMQKDLKIKKIKEPFKNLYRSANLPKQVEIGVMETDYVIVDCDYYQSGVTVLE